MNPAPGNFASRLWSIGLFFCLLFSGSGHASDFSSQFISRTWQTDDGLPHNTVQAIAQTLDGYLWIGTRDGLARFDGTKFIVFDSKNVSAIKGRIAFALCAARDGSLWIGYDDGGGIVRFKNGRFHHFGKAEGLVGDSIKTIFEGSDGTLWVGTRTGTCLFKDEQFRSFPHSDSLDKYCITQFNEDAQHRVWIVSDAGLHRYEKGILSYLPLENTLLHNIIRSIHRDHTGKLWLATTVGMVRWDEDRLTYFAEPEGLVEKFTLSAYEDRYKNLWAGTSGGLYRLSGERFYTELNSDGEPFDQVNAMFEDVEGNLWIGAKDGLSRLRPRPFTSYTRMDGLSGNNAMSLIEDKDGSIWTVTWGGGLNQIKDGKITRHHIGKRANVDHEFYLSLLKTREGVMWIGADFENGLMRITDEEIYTFHKGRGELIDHAIRVLHEDPEGSLWLGTRTALVKFSDGIKARYTTAEGLSGNLVQAIHQDQEGTLWIGTDGGLSALRHGQFQTFREGLSDTNITAIYQDTTRTIWLGTSAGGLNRLKDGKLTACSQKDGLSGNRILEIVEDDFGFFWMSSLKGISRVSKQQVNDFLDGKTNRISSTVFGREDGLVSTQCNGVAKPAGLKGRDGRIWFVTTKGLVVTDPGLQMFDDRPPSPVIVEKILADRKEVGEEAGELNDLTMPRGQTSGRLAIVPGRGELEFHYLALSFRAPEKNQFKYMLEGFDQNWIEAGTRRVASYAGLPPGDYTFRVIACGDDAVWNSQGASVHLTLLPHFWETKWFAGLVVLLTIGLIAGTVRYFIWRRVQRRLIQLENQHAIERERARIAQDMHDDLGARLTQILMLNDFALKSTGSEAEIKTHVTKVAQVTQDLVRNLDAIVWAVNPENDSLRSLALYLCEYFGMFFCPSTLRYRLDAPKEFPEWPMSSEMRHNIFLVVKEALNNIVKHAEASEVWLRLRVDETTLKICIEDNGRGFSATAESAFSSGLVNMRKRIEKCGGQFSLDSRPQGGTRVEILVSVSSAELAAN